MFAIAPEKFRRPANRFPLHRGRWLVPWFPYGHTALDTDDISQIPLRQLCPELRIVTIGCVGGNNPARQAALLCPFDLSQCDLWLGLKLDLLRYAGFFAPRRILGPQLRQIQAESDGQAGIL